MNFLIYLGSITFLTFVSLLTYNFIRDHLSYRKRMRKLNQWSQFHEQLMEWSKEIVDVEVRVNFINHCFHKLINTNVDKALIDLIDDLDIDEQKQKVFNEWGKHIPSLLQEIREKKLVKILE